MKLTPSQCKTFWRLWSAIARRARWDAQEAESERRALIERAGFQSLTAVDPLTGFDRVLAELNAILHPDNLNAQLRQVNMPRIRLIHAIRQLQDEPYILAIARDKFARSDWENLPLPQLHQLRMTLAASSRRRAISTQFKTTNNLAR